MTKTERQLKIEQEAHDFSYDKFVLELSKRISHNATTDLPEGKVLLKTAIDIVADKLKEYFKLPLRGKQGMVRMYLTDYADRPHDLALLVLTVLINNVSKENKVKLASMATRINKELYDNFVMMQFKSQRPKLYSYIEREYSGRGERYVRSRKVKLGQMKSELNRTNLDINTAKVAVVLIDIVLKSGCNIIKEEVHRNKKKTTRYLVYTEEAFNVILASRNLSIMNYQKYPILIVPPVDWEGINGNLGFYSKGLYKGSLIKARGINKKLLTSYCSNKPIDRYVSVINKIQKTSFRVNKRLFDTMDKILVDNIVDFSSPLNNPYLVGQLPFNRHQEASDYINIEEYGEIIQEGKLAGLPKDKTLYKEWYKATEIQKEKILISMAKSIGLNLALKDARRYYDETEIYFSYQADFRGRIYPIQQHLNPQSKGEIKALLEFSKGYPIETSEQLRWFKIHGANCYGKDKEVYDDRVAFIDTIEEEIHNVAEDPIRFQEYWKDTDEPFLYLAWCFEFSDLLRNPNSFRSHIPIALDATCSGIQVYSGLLLDNEGAEAVNVTNTYDGDKVLRADIYQRVANKGNEYLLKGDYEKTITFKKSDGTINECSTIAEASSMTGKINRKLTKSNTMTQPYSVTTYGMYQQLLDTLGQMEEANDKIWVGDKWVLARLLTQLNDRAIVETVRGARVGQEFLKSITADIVANGDYVFYTTPLMEFPVLQKIQKQKTLRIYTELGRLHIKTDTDELHYIKMVNGIAPNYIHSLDSTLMFLTVEKMTDCNDFHLIHDSFGVPITYVDSLNKSVRESFIELFKSKPLHKFVRQVLPNRLDEVDNVMVGDLDLDLVSESEYIFS